MVLLPHTHKEAKPDPGTFRASKFRTFMTLKRWMGAGNDPLLYRRAVHALTKIQDVFGHPAQFRYAESFSDIEEYCERNTLLRVEHLGDKTLIAIKRFFAHYGVELRDGAVR